MPAEPTVFVVDDDPAVRSSLQWLLESADLRVETFDAGERFLERIRPPDPGCLVLDLRMPGVGGLELQRLLAQAGIDLPMIIISGHADVATAVRVLKAGAIELLEKPFGDEALLERVHQALEIDATRRAHWERRARLTPREREVLDAVVAGHANKVIACHLAISERTVEVHRASVMRKMECTSVAELVRACVALER